MLAVISIKGYIVQNGHYVSCGSNFLCISLHFLSIIIIKFYMHDY